MLLDCLYFIDFFVVLIQLLQSFSGIIELFFTKTVIFLLIVQPFNIDGYSAFLFLHFGLFGDEATV